MYAENASGLLKQFSEGPSDCRRAVLRLTGSFAFLNAAPPSVTLRLITLRLPALQGKRACLLLRLYRNQVFSFTLCKASLTQEPSAGFSPAASFRRAMVASSRAFVKEIS